MKLINPLHPIITSHAYVLHPLASALRNCFLYTPNEYNSFYYSTLKYVRYGHVFSHFINVTKNYIKYTTLYLLYERVPNLNISL